MGIDHVKEVYVNIIYNHETIQINSSVNTSLFLDAVYLDVMLDMRQLATVWDKLLDILLVMCFLWH